MFLPKHLTDPVLNWAMKKEIRDKFFISPGPKLSGHVCGIPHCEEVDEDRIKSGFPYKEVFLLHQLILKEYKLPRDIPLDKEFGVLLSYSEQGHKVQTHSDPSPPGKVHTRFNCLLSKPEEGGQAIIDGKVIETEENEVWVCAAGMFQHSSVEVKGSKPRLLLSIGHYIDLWQIKDILDEKY